MNKKYKYIGGIKYQYRREDWHGNWYVVGVEDTQKHRRDLEKLIEHRRIKYLEIRNICNNILLTESTRQVAFLAGLEFVVDNHIALIEDTLRGYNNYAWRRQRYLV